LYNVIRPIEECAARLEIRAPETRAVNSDDAGAGHLSVLFGALAGIAAGASAEALVERRGPRDDTPLPPDPGVVP